MTNDGRSAIIEYLSLPMKDKDKTNGTGSNSVTIMNNKHPSIARAFKIAEKYFIDICLYKQELLDSSDTWHEILEMVPDAGTSTTFVFVFLALFKSCFSF